MHTGTLPPPARVTLGKRRALRALEPLAAAAVSKEGRRGLPWSSACWAGAVAVPSARSRGHAPPDHPHHGWGSPLYVQIGGSCCLKLKGGHGPQVSEELRSPSLLTIDLSHQVINVGTMLVIFLGT